MKKGLTHIIFVVDRSGSMQSIAADMIGGFNKYIEEQKKVPGECRVTFVQFDTEYEELYKGIPLSEVPELDSNKFIPRGSTALHDAVGRTINSVGKMLSDIPEEERPDRVLFVTVTDGMENSSREFTAAQVKEMTDLQTNNYKWEFVYIGANQDSWDVGASLGVSGTKTINYVSTGRNSKISTDALWDTLSTKSVAYRMSAAPTSFDFTKEERKKQDDLVKNNNP